MVSVSVHKPIDCGWAKIVYVYAHRPKNVSCLRTKTAQKEPCTRDKPPDRFILNRYKLNGKRKKCFSDYYEWSHINCEAKRIKSASYSAKWSHLSLSPSISTLQLRCTEQRPYATPYAFLNPETEHTTPPNIFFHHLRFWCPTANFITRFMCQQHSRQHAYTASQPTIASKSSTRSFPILSPRLRSLIFHTYTVHSRRNYASSKLVSCHTLFLLLPIGSRRKKTRPETTQNSYSLFHIAERKKNLQQKLQFQTQRATIHKFNINKRNPRFSTVGPFSYSHRHVAHVLALAHTHTHAQPPSKMYGIIQYIHKRTIQRCAVNSHSEYIADCRLLSSPIFYT